MRSSLFVNSGRDEDRGLALTGVGDGTGDGARDIGDDASLGKGDEQVVIDIRDILQVGEDTGITPHEVLKERVLVGTEIKFI